MIIKTPTMKIMTKVMYPRLVLTRVSAILIQKGLIYMESMITNPMAMSQMKNALQS